MFSRVDSLEELIIERHARLIVLDSIASVARLDFDATKTAARQDLLARIASMLKFAAERFHVPVLVSNQVTSAVRHTPVTLPHTPSVQHTSGVSSGGGGGGTFLTPALGVIWSHSINTRLALDFPPNALKLEHRRLTLAKSSMSPVLTMLYSIESMIVTWFFFFFFLLILCISIRTRNTTTRRCSACGRQLLG